jgi:tetratricopeptide (TPR) repeat protein
MSLLLDALQRASKEKEKLAESRSAATAPVEAAAPPEPAIERSPFPALSIETGEDGSDATPALELTMEMEPIVSEATPPVPLRVHDPVPMPEQAAEIVVQPVASLPEQDIQFSSSQMLPESGPSPRSSAVDDISAALAANATVLVASGAAATKVPDSRATTDRVIREEPTLGRGDTTEPPRAAGPVPHPSPTLSPQVARDILGATAKKPPNRRVLAFGAVAALVAGVYLAFFLGAFDRFLGKSGSSLTPSVPPPPAVAVVPAPTPPATTPDNAPAEGGSGKAVEAALAVVDPGSVKEEAPLPASKAPRRRAAAQPTDQADTKDGERPTARGAGSRQSRPIVVTRAVTTSPLDAAYSAMTEGRLDEAAITYRMALVANPGERDAFLGLAYIAQRKGNNDDARALYLQVLRLDPANSAANSGLLAIASEGDLPLAASRAREMAERAPNSAVVMGTLGGILAKEGRIAEAQQAYFRALTLEPENAFHAFNLAVALDKLHKNSQALSFYQRALTLAEKSPEADRSGFPFKEARQRVDQLRQLAKEPQAPARSESQGH